MITRAREGLIASLAKRKKHFRRKNAIADIFLAAGYENLSIKLRDCQQTEVLACCTSCGGRWWVIEKCKQRVCPLCSFEESKKRGKYLLAMTAHMTHPKMLTLTLPHSDNPPKEQIKFLRESFAKLRRTKLFANVVGGSYQIEVKPKTSGFHIHIHVLMDSPYMPYQKIFSTWAGITGNDSPQVDIRAADSDAAKVYVCKYTSKTADFTHDTDSIVRWYEATKGQRLFATFGKWYNATLDELMPEGTLPPEHPPCPHCGSQGTMFYARDGPFLFAKDWNSLAQSFQGQDPCSRDIPEVQAILDAKDEKGTTDKTQEMDDARKDFI
jgi:hypothetical protein